MAKNEFRSLTAEDVAINRDLAKRIPGFWGMLDHNGTAHVADRRAFARQTTLARVKAHDPVFSHHSHLATDFLAGEALDNTPRSAS